MSYMVVPANIGAAVALSAAGAMAVWAQAPPTVIGHESLYSSLLNSGSVGLLAATMLYIWHRQRSDNKETISTMRVDHKQQMSDQQKAHREQMQTLRDAHKEEMGNLRRDHREEMAAASSIGRERDLALITRYNELRQVVQEGFATLVREAKPERDRFGRTTVTVSDTVVEGDKSEGR